MMLVLDFAFFDFEYGLGVGEWDKKAPTEDEMLARFRAFESVNTCSSTVYLVLHNIFEASAVKKCLEQVLPKGTSLLQPLIVSCFTMNFLFLDIVVQQSLQGKEPEGRWLLVVGGHGGLRS